MRGVGCFMLREEAKKREEFPSPCGVWVVSHNEKRKQFELLVSVPLRGVGCFRLDVLQSTRRMVVSVPLRGVGCFRDSAASIARSICFRPLAGCGLFPQGASCATGYQGFPSPCGVWVVSRGRRLRSARRGVSVPLRGVGCFGLYADHLWQTEFPSPCGVWVVSGFTQIICGKPSFRPLAGCGLFRQSCTFFLVQQEKELSTLLFYCIILADVYQ